jgi:hypothetical protein
LLYLLAFGDQDQVHGELASASTARPTSVSLGSGFRPAPSRGGGGGFPALRTTAPIPSTIATIATIVGLHFLPLAKVFGCHG